MNKRTKFYHFKRKQSGMTFLEVLIAVVILVTGILGAVALQAVAKKSSFDSMQRSLASSLAQDIVERMRSNDSANLDDYETTTLGTGSYTTQNCSLATSNCTPDQIKTHDLFELEQILIGSHTQSGETKKNVGGLLNGLACIDVTGNRVTVVVAWEGRTKLADGGLSGTGVSTCSTTSDKRRQVVVNAYIL